MAFNSARSSSTNCICQICNCGRHRCPQHPNRAPQNGPCNLSEYNTKYHLHPIHQLASFKPAPNAQQSNDPLSNETTNRVDYIQHAIERPYQHAAEVYKPNLGNFEDTTMYKKEFTEKKAPKATLIRKDVNRGQLGKFEGEPTYKTDYIKWSMPRIEQTGNAVVWQPPKDPFSGTPTYMKDYVAHRINMQPSCKPDQTLVRNDAPLDSMTDYRNSYVKHPLERRRVEDKQEWNRPLVPFEGLSTFTRDFTPKNGDKRSMIKPNAEAFQSQAPFQDGTTMRADYKPWELERPAHHEQGIYRPPDGEMDMQTSYNRDYLKKPLIPNIKRQPENRGRAIDPFEGSSNYQDNYKKWNVGPRLHAGPKGEYLGPTVPFEGLSTHTAHYVPHPIDVRRSFKPDLSAQGGGDFDANTIYRSEYVAKVVEPCPAALLDTKTSRYEFRGEDETGHKFYESQALPSTQVPLAEFQSSQHLVSCK